MQYKKVMRSLAFDVNDLLSYYIQVHDKAIEKAGTFSSLFRRVDFEELYNEAIKVLEAVSGKYDELNFFEEENHGYMNEEEKRYLKCLLRFTEKLLETTKLLKERQRFLYDKSERKEGRRYKFDDYIHIDKLYQDSIKDYLEVGEELNDLNYIIVD